MKEIKVSVVIPTYNRAELLLRTIDSVLNQTFQDFEIIVVDDGSTDKTKQVVQEYIEKDNRITYLWQQNSGGAASPKNMGIQNAKGQYIAVLDSDDEWMPEKLEKQIQLFESSDNASLGFVGCDVFFINKKEVYYKIPAYKDLLKSVLIRDYMGPGSCIMYKKEVFDRVGLFDINLRSSQDREMRIRLSEIYSFKFVNEALVKYYIGNDNITATLGLEKREKDWEYIFNKYKKYYDEDSKMYSEKLRYDGTQYMLFGEVRKAQKRFIQSIKKNPLNIKSIGYLFYSLLGFHLYEKTAKLKMSILGLKNR